MDIYLDNNIIVSIEKEGFQLKDIKLPESSKKSKFFYSSAHIFEAVNFKGSASITREELLAQRFKTIREIFQSKYLYINRQNDIITLIIEDPKTAFDTITEFPVGIQAMNQFVNLIPKEKKTEIRQELGIESAKLNNYAPSEVIGHLNTKLISLGANMSFLEIVEYGIQLHPNGKDFGLSNRFGAVFEFLDMLGYWKDKETETSNFARLWDSLHSYFATYCDYFVSNDRRTRNKAEVVYSIYNKNTKVVGI